MWCAVNSTLNDHGVREEKAWHDDIILRLRRYEIDYRRSSAEQRACILPSSTPLSELTLTFEPEIDSRFNVRLSRQQKLIDGDRTPL